MVCNDSISYLYQLAGQHRYASALLATRIEAATREIAERSDAGWAARARPAGKSGAIPGDILGLGTPAITGAEVPEWDIGNLRRALEAEIVERIGISIHAVSMELDARLAGRFLKSAPDGAAHDHDTPVPKDDDVGSTVESDVTTTDEPEGSDLASRNKELAGTATQASVSQNDERHSDAQRFEDVDFVPQGSAIQESDESPMSNVEHLTPDATVETSAEVDLSGPTDLKSQRARSWALARRLAERLGIGELLAPLGDNGLGFLLRDGPAPALIEALDEDTLAQVSAVGWALAACSEMTVARLEHLLPAMEDSSVLKQAVRKGTVRLYGRDQDISALVREAEQQVIERLHAETRRQLGFGAELDRVLFVGGGTVALAEHIRDWFPNQAVAEHPAFANAGGMLKYLRFVCEVPA